MKAITKNNAAILGSIIKMNRLSQNMSQKSLSEGICVSSYLSRIEKGEIIPSEEVIADLFEALAIVFNDDPHFINDMQTLMHDFLEELNFNAFRQSGALYQKIEENASKLMHSPLIMDYYMVKFAYHCTMRYDDTFGQTYKLLSEMEPLMTNAQKFQLHLYYGIDLAQMTDEPREAFDSLYRAKSYGENGHLYLWLGYSYMKLNNLLKAMSQFEKALTLYVEEGNLLSIAGAYEMMGLTYYKNKHYFDGLAYFEKGVKLLEKAGAKANAAAFRNHLAWGRLRLGDFEGALSYVSDFDLHSKLVMKSSWIKAILYFCAPEVCDYDATIKGLCPTHPLDKLLMTFISQPVVVSKQGRYVDKEVLLKDLYTETRSVNHGLHDFFKSILVTYYKEKRRYKEALDLGFDN